MNFSHTYNPQLTGSILLVLGLCILYRLASRRYNRRSSAGMQGFTCNYFFVLLILLFEFMLRCAAYPMIALGAFMLLFG